MKKLLMSAAVAAFALLSACNEADIASDNISRAADNFEIPRRIVFYNGITDTYMLEIIGLCSIGNNDKPGTVTITCKTGDSQYKKHTLGLSDNVTFFAEQLEPAKVSGYHYRVMFRPQTILPDIDFDADVGELVNPSNTDK